jgi:phage protein D
MAEQITFALTIDGQAATPELLANVASIEVEEHAELADIMRLRLAIAVNPDGSDWTILADDLFPRLTPLALSVTVGTNPAEPLIEAHVVEANARFGAPGASFLEVVAVDATVLLNLDEKVKAWPDMADSDIASAIFSDHGLTADVESTQPSRQESDRTTMQRGTDMQFLRLLAARNGYECFVDVGSSGQSTGHFRPPDLQAQAQGVLSVNMGESTNVRAFTARNEMLRPTQAKAVSLDAATGEAQQSDVQQPERKALGAQPAAPSDKPRTVLLSGTGLSQAGELQTYAQSVVDASAWAIAAEGELDAGIYGGVLRAKKPVAVRGTGRQFSGTYYVERVLTVFTPDGVTQTFSLRRNALGVTSQDTFTDNRAAAS